MNRIAKWSIILLLTAALAGCAKAPDQPNQPVQPLQIQMDQTTFPLKKFTRAFTHRLTVHGKLLMGEQPVADAELHMGENKRSITTAEDGSFEILFDLSVLGQTPIKVVSLEQATVNGKPIPQKQAQTLNASAVLQVQYPIQIHSAQPSAEDPVKMIVKAQMIPDQDASVGYFRQDKYQYAGTVKDADGRPVEGATVWFERNEAELFVKSNPTDHNGHYDMYHLPYGKEEVHVSVTIGDNVKYTLSPNKTVPLPEASSMTMDIALPREGSIIGDGPPALVGKSAPGALYDGVMPGLEVPSDVAYKVTIPDAQGNFTLTVPKDVWDQHPAFFETNMSKFLNEELKPGESVPASFIEVAPNAARNVKAEMQAK